MSLTAQTDTAHKPHVHNFPVTEACGPEVDANLRQTDQGVPTRRIG